MVTLVPANQIPQVKIVMHSANRERDTEREKDNLFLQLSLPVVTNIFLSQHQLFFPVAMVGKSGSVQQAR